VGRGVRREQGVKQRMGKGMDGGFKVGLGG
jgi:hypothetical protein